MYVTLCWLKGISWGVWSRDTIVSIKSNKMNESKSIRPLIENHQVCECVMQYLKLKCLIGMLTCSQLKCSMIMFTESLQHVIKHYGTVLGLLCSSMWWHGTCEEGNRAGITDRRNNVDEARHMMQISVRRKTRGWGGGVLQNNWQNKQDV